MSNLTVSETVRAKGERLFSEGKVIALTADDESIVFEVEGDHGKHTVFVHKANIAADACSCAWNVFHHESPVCSHKFAARIVATLVGVPV